MNNDPLNQNEEFPIKFAGFLPQYSKADPKSGLVNKNHLNQTDEMINKFIVECEKEAAALEITVDYYIAEFLI